MTEQKEEKPLGMEINRLANLIRRSVDHHMLHCDCDVTSRSSGWMIRYIAEHPDQDVFQKDFEKNFSITRSTASKVVNLMVKKGLIVRSPVEYDARLKKLTLTDKGRNIHERRMANSDLFEAKLAAGFRPEELATFREYMKRMEQNIQE